jgi:hypothetical protein
VIGGFRALGTKTEGVTINFFASAFAAFFASAFAAFFTSAFATFLFRASSSDGQNLSTSFPVTWLHGRQYLKTLFFRGRIGAKTPTSHLGHTQRFRLDTRFFDFRAIAHLLGFGLLVVAIAVAIGKCLPQPKQLSDSVFDLSLVFLPTVLLCSEDTVATPLVFHFMFRIKDDYDFPSVVPDDLAVSDVDDPIPIAFVEVLDLVSHHLQNPASH